MSLNIPRINELARKSRTPEGLTEEEKQEQAILRRAYIDSVVGNMRGQLENTYIVDGKNDPIKLEPKSKK